MKKFILLLFILAGGISLQAESPLRKRLLLPDKIYAVPGIECNIYFENIFLTINPENYVFEVKCAKGRCDEKRWRFIPKASDAGTYELQLNVHDDSGRVAAASSKLVVVPADAGEGKNISLLLTGDSSLEMRHAFPTHLHKLFQTSGNPILKMIGENGPGWPDMIGEIRHEGYGGWSFATFTTAGRPVIKGRSNARGNPFWNSRTKSLDFASYFRKNNEGKAPDFVLISLGGNDVFLCTDRTIDPALEVIGKQAATLYSGIRKAAPEAVIALILPEYCSHSQDAFGRNYGCRQTRWQFKKNLFRYRSMAEELVRRSGDPKFLTVPCYTALDTVNNVNKRQDVVNDRNRTPILRESNGLHPHISGYQQLADSCYAWLKGQISRLNK